MSHDEFLQIIEDHRDPVMHALADTAAEWVVGEAKGRLYGRFVQALGRRLRAQESDK
jgi:hypothetical protein